MDVPKYIVFDGSAIAMPDFPIVFPCYMEHTQIASKFPMSKPIGAGYVNFGANLVSCHGKSIGLNLSSRPEDSEIIAKQFKIN